MMKFIEDLFKKAIEHWLTTLAAAVVITAQFIYFKKWLLSKILSFLSWLVESSSYPNWIVIVLGLVISLLTTWLVIILYRRIKANKPPIWHRYTSDTFNDVKWNWKYTSDNDYYYVFDMRPSCKNCRSDVEFIEGSYSVAAFCRSCDSHFDELDATENGYKDMIQNMIRQQVRKRFGVE